MVELSRIANRESETCEIPLTKGYVALVTRHESGLWRAYVGRKFLGYFKTPEAADAARRQALGGSP